MTECKSYLLAERAGRCSVFCISAMLLLLLLPFIQAQLMMPVCHFHAVGRRAAMTMIASEFVPAAERDQSGRA